MLARWPRIIAVGSALVKVSPMLSFELMGWMSIRPVSTSSRSEQAHGVMLVEAARELVPAVHDALDSRVVVAVNSRRAGREKRLNATG